MGAVKREKNRVAPAGCDGVAREGNSRALPVSESDPDVAQLAERWHRNRPVHAGLIEFAEREGLTIDDAAHRAIWLGIQWVDRIQDDEQRVKLGKHGNTRMLVPARDLNDRQWNQWWRARARSLASDIVTGGATRSAPIGDDPSATQPAPIDPDSLAEPWVDPFGVLEDDDRPIRPSDWRVEDFPKLTAAASDDELLVLNAFKVLASDDEWPSWRRVDRYLERPAGWSGRVFRELKARICAAAAA